MSELKSTESVDVKYYFNKKSKYFQDMKEDDSVCGRMSVKIFLKYLSTAYLFNKATEPVESYICNDNVDWTKITRSELFSELLDVDETTLYSVIKETNDLNKLDFDKGYEVYNDCNYLFSIPSETTLTTSSASSEKLLILPNSEFTVEIQQKLQCVSDQNKIDINTLVKKKGGGRKSRHVRVTNTSLQKPKVERDLSARKEIIAKESDEVRKDLKQYKNDETICTKPEGVEQITDSINAATEKNINKSKPLLELMVKKTVEVQ